VNEVIVRGTVTRWVDDAFPGWVEVTLTAADGNTHRIVEKVPVLTNAAITAARFRQSAGDSTAAPGRAVRG
jgi:hypothetical protein